MHLFDSIVRIFFIPILLPIIVTVISWYFTCIRKNKENLIAGHQNEKDNAKYKRNIDLTLHRIQDTDFIYHVSYALLSHAIWGFSTVFPSRNSNFANYSNLYESFLITYFLYFGWSMVVIVHSNYVNMFNENRWYKLHVYIAVIVFLLTRILLFVFVDL